MFCFPVYFERRHPYAIYSPCESSDLVYVVKALSLDFLSWKDSNNSSGHNLLCRLLYLGRVNRSLARANQVQNKNAYISNQECAALNNIQNVSRFFFFFFRWEEFIEFGLSENKEHTSFRWAVPSSGLTASWQVLYVSGLTGWKGEPEGKHSKRLGAERGGRKARGRAQGRHTARLLLYLWCSASAIMWLSVELQRKKAFFPHYV